MGDAARRDTLIVYVPGFAEGGQVLRLRGFVRYAMADPDPPGEITSRLPRPQELTLAGYTALRYTVDAARNVDIVEVPWNADVPALSKQTPLSRVLRGAALLVINFAAALGVPMSSPGFLVTAGVALALMVFWWYFALTTAVGAADAFAKQAGTDVASTLWPPLADVWTALEPKGLFYLVLAAVAAAFAAFRISPDDVVDVADRYDRFTHDKRGADGVGMRNLVTDRVIDAVVATAGAGPYARVLLLGHSFGALVACAAVPRIPAERAAALELVTLGTFFAYISAFDTLQMEALFDAVCASPIAAWHDYFSWNDWLSSNFGYRDYAPGAPGTVYKPKRVGDRWHVSWWDRVTTRTHRYYFHDPDVIGELFRDPHAAGTSDGAAIASQALPA